MDHTKHTPTRTEYLVRAEYQHPRTGRKSDPTSGPFRSRDMAEAFALKLASKRGFIRATIEEVKFKDAIADWR